RLPRLPAIPSIRPVSGYHSRASRVPTDYRSAEQSPAVVRRLLADRPARLITGHYFANCQRTLSLYPLCPLKFNSDNPALSESGKDAQKNRLLARFSFILYDTGRKTDAKQGAKST